MSNTTVTMAIFEVENKHTKDLCQIIENLDKSHSPIGTGGYSVRKERHGVYYLTELDTAPARTFKIGVKDGQIWAPFDLATPIFAALKMEEIHYKRHTFTSKEEAKKAFGEH